jgi:hypothetical protein
VQTNPFRLRKKGSKATKKQGKNLHVKKAKVLQKDASTESVSHSSKYGIT